MSTLLDSINNQDSKEEIRVFVTSWNMGNAEAVGLNNIFSERNAFDEYDVVAIGLQESTYSSKSSTNFDSIPHLKAYMESLFGSRFYVVCAIVSKICLG